MYVIVEKAKLEGKFFGIMNTLPDGRVYIPISEMRNVGTLLDIDIIGSARELKELIEKQQEAMQGTEDIDPGFSVTPEEEEEMSMITVMVLPTLSASISELMSCCRIISSSRRR